MYLEEKMHFECERKQGIIFYHKTGKYGAHIYCFRKDFYLGTFETSIEAIKRRIEAEKIYHAFSLELCDSDMLPSDRIAEFKKRLNIRDGRLVLNKRMQSSSKSGHFGVCEVKRVGKTTGRWQAYISWMGKRIHLGYFSTKEEAISAREKAEKSYIEMTGIPFDKSPVSVVY